MDTRIAEILQAALTAAAARGVSRPRRGDLRETDLRYLAGSTLQFLSSRPHKASPYPGWAEVRGFDAGVLRWWNQHLGGPFPSAVTEALQSLRRDVYDFLDEEGRIVKEPGQSAPVHLAPLSEAEAEDGHLDAARSVHLSDSGAGFGDAETNALVEDAAMRAVIKHFADWHHKDVSSKKVGWDISFSRGQETRRIEVKGVSGQQLKVLLTRNEVAAARMDSTWSLAVVTRALVAPEVHEVSRDQVLDAVVPFVFVADLSLRR